ncbi:MAG: manganese efflux pump [Lachnospiraceae bacterium]
MNIVEALIVILGISLDVFAVMECQGSMVAKVEKKQLLILSSSLAVGQVAALGIGNIISVLLCKSRRQVSEIFLAQVIAAVIFLGLGIYLLWKAWQNERIIEHREEKFDVFQFVRLYVKIGILTLLIGLAFGFLESNMVIILMISAILTVLVTIVGIYTGYRLGFEHKMKAYVLGGILLILGGLDVIISRIFK